MLPLQSACQPPSPVPDLFPVPDQRSYLGHPNLISLVASLHNFRHFITPNMHIDFVHIRALFVLLIWAYYFTSKQDLKLTLHKRRVCILWANISSLENSMKVVQMLKLDSPLFEKKLRGSGIKFEWSETLRWIGDSNPLSKMTKAKVTHHTVNLLEISSTSAYVVFCGDFQRRRCCYI